MLMILTRMLREECGELSRRIVRRQATRQKVNSSSQLQQQPHFTEGYADEEIDYFLDPLDGSETFVGLLAVGWNRLMPAAAISVCRSVFSDESQLRRMWMR
jgi:hypothetical protein